MGWGEYIKLTHATDRQKYRNITRDPRVSLSITDVDDPYTYAEFRGVVEKIEDDSRGDFLNTLAHHYGQSFCSGGEPRVIFFVKVHHVVGRNLQPPEGFKAETECGETRCGA